MDSFGLKKGGMLLLSFLTCFFFNCQNAISLSYYVDSNNGSDLNPGNSTTYPLKTLKKLSKKDLKPGDTIYLKRNSHWNENVVLKLKGTVQDPIRITAYGKGEAPEINSVGRIIKWRDSLDESVFISQSFFHCYGIFEDGKKLKEASTDKLRDGSWFYKRPYIYYSPYSG